MQVCQRNVAKEEKEESNTNCNYVTEEEGYTRIVIAPMRRNYEGSNSRIVTALMNRNCEIKSNKRIESASERQEHEQTDERQNDCFVNEYSDQSWIYLMTLNARGVYGSIS